MDSSGSWQGPVAGFQKNSNGILGLDGIPFL